MNENPSDERDRDRRNEPREPLEQFYSVEMNIGGSYSAYQFKLRNISESGLCILVREDSSVLEKISVGKAYEVKFYQDGDPNPAKFARAEVRHLTRQMEGRYQGHYLIGLAVTGETEPDREITPGEA
ncbi:MAG: PilZ domain-containing protein [Desulfobacterales bacterium]|jgi:hypothetical protein